MLILLVGLPSSGKTTAARIMEKMGFQVVSSGDVVREEIEARGLPYTVENDIKITRWFHEGREDLLLKRLITRSKSDRMVWDGPRSIEQLESLKKMGESPVIIAIRSDFDSRLIREMRRNRFTRFTDEDMKKRDEQHVNMGTKELMERADYTIDNTSLTKEELASEIRKILKTRGIKNI